MNREQLTYNVAWAVLFGILGAGVALMAVLAVCGVAS